MAVNRMIVEPEQRVADFVKAGSDIVSVHAEQSATIHLHRLVNNVSIMSVQTMLHLLELKGLNNTLQCQSLSPFS